MVLNVEASRQLTKDELRDLALAFKNCDKNGDDRVTTDELVNLIADLDRNMSRDQAIAAIKAFDTDKDHGLNFEELCSLWLTMRPKEA